jgi:hypothetical protein
MGRSFELKGSDHQRACGKEVVRLAAVSAIAAVPILRNSRFYTGGPSGNRGFHKMRTAVMAGKTNNNNTQYISCFLFLSYFNTISYFLFLSYF